MFAKDAQLPASSPTAELSLATEYIGELAALEMPIASDAADKLPGEDAGEDDEAPAADVLEVVRFEQELAQLHNRKLACNACKRSSEDFHYIMP